ncbi:hypothetical protein [Nocardia cyriacigeorgica]|uniref:hypothetical protein n=1 Tax=Nocardia cyriacigeorgica TaxID=135487 RepID=UPI0024537974|nr:hypothetical protein [Nocardia cyriacigeorgica]
MITQVMAQMGLRAPRVALVVPGDHAWHDHFRHAIWLASTTWGGAGFVVVPHHDGRIDQTLVAAVREYDPDYIVRLPDFCGGPDTPSSSSTADPCEIACRELSSVCADFRSAHAESFLKPKRSDFRMTFYQSGPHGSPLMPMAEIDKAEPVAEIRSIGAAPDLEGGLGLAAAMAWGSKARAGTGSAGPLQTPHRAATIENILSDRCVPLPGVTDSDVGNLPTDFDRTSVGTAWLSEVNSIDRPSAVVVVGDEAADAALAMIWDRIYGAGKWIPTEWWTDASLRQACLAGLDRFARGVHGEARSLVFTSTSIGLTKVRQIANEFENRLPTVFSASGERVFEDPEIKVVDSHSLGLSRFNKRHLAAEQNYLSEWSTAVSEDNGSYTMQSLPPLPTFDHPTLNRVDHMNWLVDVTLPAHSALVGGCMIPPRELIADGENEHLTWYRSSRRGISYEARRYSWVMAGASLEWQLSRPKLCFPALDRWAAARGRIHDLTTQPSTPGSHAQILAELMGGRTALAALLSGPLASALQEFLVEKPGAATRRYADGQGWTMRGETYLTFSGIKALSDPSGPDEMSRDLVDELSLTGVLHRGLILRCSACTHRSFISVDDLAANTMCPRCRRVIPLTRKHWIAPPDEPQWYYDLHPTARTLLQENGNYPLLLSHYLRTKSRRGFADTHEFEYLRNDDKECETDLLALADRQVIVAEVKNSDSIGTNAKQRNAAVTKRLRAAEILCADEIVLATSKPKWTTASLNAFIDRLTANKRHGEPVPRLRQITGLGSSSVGDEIISI